MDHRRVPRQRHPQEEGEGKGRDRSAHLILAPLTRVPHSHLRLTTAEQPPPARPASLFHHDHRASFLLFFFLHFHFHCQQTRPPPPSLVRLLQRSLLRFLFCLPLLLAVLLP